MECDVGVDRFESNCVLRGIKLPKCCAIINFGFEGCSQPPADSDHLTAGASNSGCLIKRTIFLKLYIFIIPETLSGDSDLSYILKLPMIAVRSNILFITTRSCTRHVNYRKLHVTFCPAFFLCYYICTGNCIGHVTALGSQ